MNKEDLISQAAQKALQVKKALIVAPPGFGKTRIAFEIARQLGTEEFSVILHRKPLMEQWENRAILEGFSVCIISAAADPFSVRQRHFLLFIDEAHHLVSDTFGDLLACLTSKYQFGLTATPPSRPKQIRLLGHFFPKTILVKPPLERKPIIHIVYTCWEFNNDFERGVHPLRNDLICELSEGKTLALTRLVSHQKELEEAYGFEVWRPPDRMPPPNSDRFVGTYSYISEGIHIDDIETVILATPSQSVIRLVQSIGRGNHPKCERVYVLIDLDCIRLRPRLFESAKIIRLPFRERIFRNWSNLFSVSEDRADKAWKRYFKEMKKGRVFSGVELEAITAGFILPPLR